MKGALMEDYYCPVCFDKLERLSGCGAVGYMCNTCKHLISRQKMLTEQQAEDAKSVRGNNSCRKNEKTSD
jgi:hypothetical protein